MKPSTVKRSIMSAMLVLSTFAGTTSLFTARSQAQDKPPFTFSYVKVEYTCKTYGSTKSVYVFSEVFGACYQETSHIPIARDHLRSAEQAAGDACGGGTVTYVRMDRGIPYDGAAGRAHAESDRDNDIASVGRFSTTGSFFIPAPYSGKCR